MDTIRLIFAGALALLCAGPSAAQELSPDFTRSFGLEQALADAPALPGPGDPKLQFFSKLRATKDCKFITFKAGDAPVSRPAALASYVFEEVCEEYQDGKHCFENLLRKETRKVVVELAGDRTPLPWEREVFGVCLEDTSVTVEIAEASHKYKITKKPGLPEYRVEALAEGKLAAGPDPSAIVAGPLEASEGPCGLKLEFRDKWAGTYAAAPGERTVLRLTLKQDNPAWFDGVMLEQELELAPESVYRIDFSQFSSEFRRPLEPGRQYYVKWSFSRKGSISKKTFINGGETPRTVFVPR